MPENRILSQSTVTARISAPVYLIDLADWLLNLPDQEYQRCAPPDHLAAGYTVTDGGRPMLVTVEMIGNGLVIQHYVAEIARRQHCHLVSLSDVLTPCGRTTVRVTWDLSVAAADDGSCACTSTVTSHPTRHFLEFIAANGQTFAEAAAAGQAACAEHLRRETPLFAASIERKALASRDSPA